MERSSSSSSSCCGTVGIIGSGTVGRSWAILFAKGGFDVSIFDLVADNSLNAIKCIRDEILPQLISSSSSSGDLSPSIIMSHIKVVHSIDDILNDSSLIHLQECVFENVEIKKNLFDEIRKRDICNKDATIGSSTSAILPSKLFHQFDVNSMVVHPINPPLSVPLVEIVPHSKTSPSSIKAVKTLIKSIGQKPIVLSKEIEGFIVNRLQYSLMSEAYRLVADGVASASDVDAAMSHGLGKRYSFMGPWEVAHLNAPKGLRDYSSRYSDTIRQIVKQQAEDNQGKPLMDSEVIERIHNEMEERFGPGESSLKKAVQWRDSRLLKLREHQLGEE